MSITLEDVKNYSSDLMLSQEECKICNYDIADKIRIINFHINCLADELIKLKQEKHIITKNENTQVYFERLIDKPKDIQISEELTDCINNRLKMKETKIKVETGTDGNIHYLDIKKYDKVIHHIGVFSDKKQINLALRAIDKLIFQLGYLENEREI